MLAQSSLFTILAMVLVAIAVFETYNTYKEAFDQQILEEEKLASTVFETWKRQTEEYASKKLEIYECSHERCSGLNLTQLVACLNQNCSMASYYVQEGAVYANFSIEYANESVYLNTTCLNSTGWDSCFGGG